MSTAATEAKDVVSANRLSSARRKARRLRRSLAALAVALALPYAATCTAATGLLYARGVTGPGGQVTMGRHLWVSDHTLGLCRVDPTPLLASDLNPTTCNLAAVSPGQPAYDPVQNYVYVPDNSAKSRGVWRLTFDPATQTVGNPVLLAGGAGGLAGSRATATALGPDGALYVGFIKNGSVLRVINPGGAFQSVQTIGQTSDGRGVTAMAFAGPDLYLAEGGAVTRIANAAACAGSCVGAPVAGLGNVTTPTALAAFGADVLFVADTPAAASTVIRHTVSAGTTDIYANAANTGAQFQSVSGLSVDGLGNVYVGADPSLGHGTGVGSVWSIPAGSAPLVAGSPSGSATSPLAATEGTLAVRGLTAPGGAAPMGTRLWFSDRALGFCRVDANAAGTSDLNGTTCNRAAGTPGQPAFDASRNLVYVPDSSPTSRGVWRLTFNAANETVGNPVLLAGGTGGLTGNQATASALGPDGQLYVGFAKNGNILRVSNPSGAVQTVQTIAKSASGKGVAAMTFMGGDLYLAEPGGVTRVANAAACAGSCTATSVASTGAVAPTALASDGANVLYIANSPGLDSQILRYTLSGGTATLYADAGDGQPLQAVSALALTGSGDLYAGDDPSKGTQPGLGRGWKITPPAP